MKDEAVLKNADRATQEWFGSLAAAVWEVGGSIEFEFAPDEGPQTVHSLFQCLIVVITWSRIPLKVAAQEEWGLGVGVLEREVSIGNPVSPR